jgi:hypothetical protein
LKLEQRCFDKADCRMSSVQVTLKVLRWEERDKRLIIKEAQIVG